MVRRTSQPANTPPSRVERRSASKTTITDELRVPDVELRKKAKFGPWKSLIETLEEYFDGDALSDRPQLAALRNLFVELEAVPDRPSLTQLEVRKFFLKRMATESHGRKDVGPITLELAHLGTFMAALIEVLSVKVSTATRGHSDAFDKSHQQDAMMTVKLLREYLRCFQSAGANLGRDFGLVYVDKLHDALIERAAGRNSPLLVTGPLADELAEERYSNHRRMGIEALAAAIVEAMVVGNVSKKMSQVQAAKAVAAALTKGSYNVRGPRKTTSAVHWDTVKRWHNRAKRTPRRDAVGWIFSLLYFQFRGVLVDRAKEGPVDDQLKILTLMCERLNQSGRRRSKSKA